MDTKESIIYSGKWWLPSEKQKEIGILQIINDKEIRLVLNFSLDIKPGKQINSTNNFEIILGETDNDEKITLCNCHGDAIFGKLFKIEWVFIGEHFNTLEDIKFKSIELKYTYLDEWAYPFWYTQSIYHGEKEDKTTYIKKVKTTYIKKSPTKISLDIPENKINLIFHFNLINFFDNSNKKYKEREVILLAESNEQKTFTKWWDIITIIRNFLILGTIKPIYPSIVRANINKRKKVSIYRALNINVNLSRLSFSDMLFTLNDVEKDMEKYLRNWFIKSNKLKNIVTGLFIVLNNPGMGLENQLIYLSGLTEWYYRDNKKEYLIMDRQEYENLRVKIIDLIKNNTDLDPCFIKNNIVNKYGYQKNFRTILKELINQVGEIFPLENNFKKYYCNKTVDTRNYFVHKDKQSKNKAAKGRELYCIIKFLEMIIVLNLLLEIKFDKEILEKIFKKHDEFYESYRSIRSTVKK